MTEVVLLTNFLLMYTVEFCKLAIAGRLTAELPKHCWLRIPEIVRSPKHQVGSAGIEPTAQLLPEYEISSVIGIVKYNGSDDDSAPHPVMSAGS